MVLNHQVPSFLAVHSHLHAAELGAGLDHCVFVFYCMSEDNAAVERDVEEREVADRVDTAGPEEVLDRLEIGTEEHPCEVLIAEKASCPCRLGDEPDFGRLCLQTVCAVL